MDACGVSAVKYTRVLVTGGRTYGDRAHVFTTLDAALRHYGAIVVIEGGARGADEHAKFWCKATGVPCITMDAPWDALGKQAGSIRNRWMVDLCAPDVVLAFPGGVGTAHMRAYAASKGIQVFSV